MNDWYSMQVVEEKISGKLNHYKFTVGNDVIEMLISYPTGSYFEDLHTQILNHYILNTNNKPSNPNRTSALYRRIYTHIRINYLKKLEKHFNEIASQPQTEKLINTFSCMGHTFYEGLAPREVFTWFFKHYTSTCASGDFYEFLIKLPKTNGFLNREIASYLTF